MSERQGAGREPEASGESADPFEGLVLDEDFVKGAEKSEGSARARMLAAKWRENPPERVGFREAADNPPPSRFRRTRQRDAWGRPARRDRTSLKIAVWFVLLALLLLIASNKGYFRDLLGGSNSDDGPDTSMPMTAQPQVTGVASAAPVPGTAPIDPDVPTREKPFAGSPAINYADNEAGIVLPEAKAVGDYSAATVQKALENTRKLLIAGNLDRSVLTGGATKPYLDLLDPESGVAENLAKAIAHPDAATNGTALGWITRFDATQVELVGSVVKVDGIMAYKVDDDGILTIHTDYSFVYAVAKAGHPDGQVTRALMRRVVDTQVIGKNTRYQPTAPGTLRLAGGSAQASNSSCDVLDGYVRPYFDDTPERIRPSGPEMDPYDRAKPLETAAPTPSGTATDTPDDAGCGRSSRI